jgi:3',5'-cyclic-AMP phosphodiesterase
MDTRDKESLVNSRRGLLKCMAWAGTGIVWSVVGGVPKGVPIGMGLSGTALAATSAFTFVQISDSHIGFKADANPDPNATLKDALDKAVMLKPTMMVHTGDITHLSKPEQFDTAHQIIKGAKLDTHFVPGEHDVIGDDGKMYFERFGGNGAAPGGWYSFDQGGVHFVALMNVIGFGPATGATLGKEQIDWLEKDLEGKSASTPIVVLAHIPLWSIYPQWGWITADADQVFTHLKRFGSVTVLNGHIHQVVQKVEGKVTFQTAMSTAFPQPAAGTAPNPGPMKVPADKLKSVLGIREITYAPDAAPKLTDQTLA